jgi:hypothetical protein
VKPYSFRIGASVGSAAAGSGVVFTLFDSRCQPLKAAGKGPAGLFDWAEATPARARKKSEARRYLDLNKAENITVIRHHRVQGRF